jgi:hypothetical protein
MTKIKLCNEQKEILYGTLLGDGWLETATKGRTYRFGFKQKIQQKDYVDYVYSKLNCLCKSKPIPNRTDYQFKTLTLPCLRFYGHQFYGENNKKKIPKLIHRWLTPRVLAHWYMDDGYKHNYGCYLYTNCFEKQDVQRLCNSLQRNFNFDCGLRKKKINGENQWFIYISSQSFKDFSLTIEPYVVPTMKYKLYSRK